MERLDHGIAYNFLNPIPATLDEGWYILVPPSTMYDGPKIQYWHPEACVGGCICEPKEERSSTG
jgi:hypothetical protein